MKLQAQRYRHRVGVQARTESQDANTGAVTYEWGTVYLSSTVALDSVPAEVLTGPGREALAADVKTAETAARINMRWFPGLRADMRLIWDGRYFGIVSIETDATGRMEYRLRCSEGMTDGG